MSIKENANTLIDNSANVPYSNVSGKPTKLVETITISGTGTFYTADYLGLSKTLTFRKIT